MASCVGLAVTRALALAALAALWFVACDEAPPPEPAKTATPRPPARPDPCKSSAPPAYCDAGTIAPSGVGCAYQLADGVCQSGPDGDGCGCVDCAGAARCAGRCVDDGLCDLDGAREDCTCVDCDRAVPACAPPSVGCKTDGICSAADDDCACPDCVALPACHACVSNGACVPYLEGCACADCAGRPSCADGGAP